MEGVQKHIHVYTAICSIFDGLNRYGKKNYCWPAQTKILKLLENFHGITMCRRTLNMRLKEMVALNLIHRIRRHHRGAHGEMCFKTTAYYILQRAAESVKRIFRSMLKIADVLRVQKLHQYSLTTQRDIDRTSVPEAEQVPLDWIKDFRKQLSAA